MEGESLNTIIKFDLHIHSKASGYKESAGVVDQSTKENIDVLLSQLHEHQIALFSITDHNRIDADLYLEISNVLSQPNHSYPNVKRILAGVEFDVKLDKDMEKCHIIAIFDVKNDSVKLSQIKEGIEGNLLSDPQNSYTRNEFENILEQIGLNTILIASQKKDIHNKSGRYNALSDSVVDVEQIIRMGYIDALEFQKPKVEGILLNNLKTLSLPTPLFSGSDCHDWACYPYHDSQNQNKEFHHSRAKMLPTFKGLLMAITSPETRFNSSENINTSVINGIELKGQKTPFVNGINAIIGENGSGKTTLLKLINNKLSESHVKKLIQDNALKTENYIDPQKVKYIEQGQIIKKFNDKTLFVTGDGSNFQELDNTPFAEVYSNYSDILKEAIRILIKKQEAVNSLSERIIAFEEGMIAKNYYVDITDNESLEGADNPHEKARKNIKALIKKAKSLLDDDYFEPYKTQLEQVVKELYEIGDNVECKWRTVDFEINVKNIMHGCTNDYLRKVKENSSAKDREIKEYEKTKQLVINSVLDAVKISIKDISWPDIPPVLEGVTRNPKQGFYFNREAMYNDRSMLDDFFSKMFVKAYGDVEKLRSIKSVDQFVSAIRNCAFASDIDTKWEENFKKFIDDATKTNDYITDGTDQQIGNTLGEMSLSYYKFFTQDHQKWNVFVIDQPEDNISNSNISQKLISYFNDIRYEKQIIFVTHNPLLVVNLDADNVIFVENNKGNLSASNGCLEYEDEETNILELVAQNMDGGRETIEKRVRIYGKSY